MNRSAVCTWAHVRGEERFARAGKVHADICIAGHMCLMKRVDWVLLWLTMESLFKKKFFLTSNDPDRCLANYTAPIAFYIFSALSPASV